MPREVKENPIGESIYNKIKDYDIKQRKDFFKTISKEHKDLYDKYNTFKRGQNRNPRYGGDLDKARDKAMEGMKRLRESRSKEELQKQRKPWDTKYNAKRKLTPDEASTVIQRQYRRKALRQATNKLEAMKTGSSMIDDLFKNTLNSIPERGVGRPRKPRNPVGRPPKQSQ